MPLIFTTTRRGAIKRATFDGKSWRPAVEAAGIVPTRATGMHALRHFYASALLDAGESIKALASYLGHSDPGFTLRVYTHLMPPARNAPGTRSTACSARLLGKRVRDSGLPRAQTHPGGTR
ncbi:tyrosine-type recombinase/integrase [Micromonospora sp. WMMD718]|uniref:tyrosine-type recombinase/integrase n=1 Tax=Micromonospora TaxID=1873 RepID=UPI001F0E054A|nr:MULTISPECIES: tyrosine-type recombinase/integrase [Micromonospora]MDG4753446.1 tyrosine-type recombinase/integrase [Micromonospora sp. WMMD718]